MRDRLPPVGRTRPVTEAEQIFDEFPELAHHDECMRAMGFQLIPRVMLHRKRVDLITVRLVWRNRKCGSSTVLHVAYTVN